MKDEFEEKAKSLWTEIANIAIPAFHARKSPEKTGDTCRAVISEALRAEYLRGRESMRVEAAKRSAEEHDPWHSSCPAPLEIAKAIRGIEL